MVDTAEPAMRDEAPPGYKMTELGPLPEDWDVARVRNVVLHVFGGGTPSTKRREFWEGNIPWTTSAYLNGIDLNAAPKTISAEGLQRSASSLVPAGNLLVGTRVGVGKVAVNHLDVAISQDLTGLIVDREQAEPRFLAYALVSDEIQKRLRGATRGTTIKGVPREDLLNMPLPLPSLPEQRAIAHVLSTLHGAREATERVIAATRELKKSLMRYLFTYGPVPVDQAEQVVLKETEVGEVPARWTVVALGDLMQNPREAIQTGPFGSQLHASDYRMDGVPVVNPTHLGTNQIHTTALPRVASDLADGLGRHYLREGDVLVPRRGDFGRHAYIHREQAGWLCGTGCIRLRMTNSDLDNRFLALWLGTDAAQSHLRDHATGSIMPNLNQQILSSLPVLLPPKRQQGEIVAAIDAVEAKMAVEEERARALNRLFQSLLREILTGRARTRLAR